MLLCGMGYTSHIFHRLCSSNNFAPVSSKSTFLLSFPSHFLTIQCSIFLSSFDGHATPNKGSFYIVQYPVRWTARSASHFLPSLTDLFIPTPFSASPGSILARQQLCAKTKSLTFPPLSIARYSFIQLSEQGRQWGEQKCPIFETVAKGDSNPGSLDCESGILPLSYCATVSCQLLSITGLSLFQSLPFMPFPSYLPPCSPSFIRASVLTAQLQLGKHIRIRIIYLVLFQT